jgi:hypothetical protein
MGRQGRREREARYQGHLSGWTATHSQDYLFLASRLYGLSYEEATKAAKGNASFYVFAGIPILLAALRALVAEYEFIVFLPTRRKPPDVNTKAFVTDYAIVGDLLDDLNDLIELRNEIIHPAHATCGAKDNWPPYLTRVKGKGLLNSTGKPQSDYTMLGQMASHRLFTWAVGVTRELYVRVIESDPARALKFRPFLKSFDPTWFVGVPVQTINSVVVEP